MREKSIASYFSKGDEESVRCSGSSKGPAESINEVTVIDLLGSADVSTVQDTLQNDGT